jgi:hypothetical protein
MPFVVSYVMVSPVDFTWGGGASIPALLNQVDAAANSVEASARTSTLARENFILSCLVCIAVGKDESARGWNCYEGEEKRELVFCVLWLKAAL